MLLNAYKGYFPARTQFNTVNHFIFVVY